MKLKKAVSLLLAVLTVFSMLQITASAETRQLIIFADVTGHWAYDAVMWAVDSKVASGVNVGGERHFLPDQKITRAEAVTFLWAYYGHQTPKSETSPFHDFSGNHWAYDAILWAAENKIVGGTSATTFSPEKVCTIEEVITMMYAMAGRPDVHVADGYRPFPNIKSSNWLYAPLTWFVEKGLRGTTSTLTIPSNYVPSSNQNFVKNQNCTRALMVAMLYNYNCFSKGSSRLNLKSAVNRMMTIAEREKNLWENPTSDYPRSQATYDKPSGPWCAAFVSWCAKEAGLAKDKPGQLGPFYTDPEVSDYNYPVLRAAWCSHIGTRFSLNGSLFVTSIDGSDFLQKARPWGDATKVSESGFVPRGGDIVLFYSTTCTCGSCNGRDITHIGIVYDVTPIDITDNNNVHYDYEIKTIEGNTTGGVAVCTYNIDLKTGKTNSKTNNLKYMAAFGRIW